MQVGCNAILEWRQERNLAVAMAFHSRLGKDSSLALLDRDLLELVTTPDETIHCAVLVNGVKVNVLDLHRISKVELRAGTVGTPYTILEVKVYDTVTLIFRGAVDGLESIHCARGFMITDRSLETPNPDNDGEGVLHVITQQVCVWPRWPPPDVYLIHTEGAPELPPMHKIVLAVDLEAAFQEPEVSSSDSEDEA